MMKVEIWSDIACPFCWIGKHHFEHAVKELALEDIEVKWRSFELDPYAQKEYDDDLYTLLANKYGQTRDWAVRSAEQMAERGKAIGLDFEFDSTISTNTFDAHRVIHMAKAHGIQKKMKEMLFEAYFKEGQHIGDREVLVEIAGNAGLDPDAVRSMLDSNQYAEEVRKDEIQAQNYGIRGVPYFVIDEKYGVSGAQPIGHFVEVLGKIAAEKSVEKVEFGEAGAVCDDDSCET